MIARGRRHWRSRRFRLHPSRTGTIVHSPVAPFSTRARAQNRDEFPIASSRSATSPARHGCCDSAGQPCGPTPPVLTWNSKTAGSIFKRATCITRSPRPCLIDLHGDDLFQGLVVDVTDDGGDGTYAVVEVEGVKQPLVVAVRHILGVL